MKNKYYIEFEANAFERQAQRGRISTRKIIHILLLKYDI